MAKNKDHARRDKKYNRTTKTTKKRTAFDLEAVIGERERNYPGIPDECELDPEAPPNAYHCTACNLDCKYVL